MTDITNQDYEDIIIPETGIKLRDVSIPYPFPINTQCGKLILVVSDPVDFANCDVCVADNLIDGRRLCSSTECNAINRPDGKYVVWKEDKIAEPNGKVHLVSFKLDS